MSYTNNISMYEIFDYWKDKQITPSGEIIKNKEINNNINVIEDWGEPECFACGLPASIEDIPEYEQLLFDEDGLKKIWNSKIVSKKLQKAHIIPKSLGGSIKPENIFCLCRKCHQNSPDTKYKKEFLKWVYKRRIEPPYIFKSILQAIDELQSDGIPLDFAESIDFQSKLKNVTTHFNEVAESSIVALIVGGVEEEFNNRTKEVAA